MKLTYVELWNTYTPGHGSPVHTIRWTGDGEEEEAAFRLARERAREFNRTKHKVNILVSGALLVDVKTGKRWALTNLPLRAPIDDGQIALPLADARQPSLF